ncbi:hypothetical protein GDO86_016989 [Hymenochirus boettgeri]|uniref:Secreted protein n=1 Tax=Hymenochirus boettgeri TaxID=247094 RepID=A0A8T2IND0_9PIPI|nr:hypothetical protein GDO86_016989 [Hymenochirus boettgeri]
MWLWIFLSLLHLPPLSLSVQAKDLQPRFPNNNPFRARETCNSVQDNQARMGFILHRRCLEGTVLISSCTYFCCMGLICEFIRAVTVISAFNLHPILILLNLNVFCFLCFILFFFFFFYILSTVC